ncbi:hypothetical protein C2E23DRAFT_894505, partial [Lenzites betulinus]
MHCQWGGRALPVRARGEARSEVTQCRTCSYLRVVVGGCGRMLAIMPGYAWEYSLISASAQAGGELYLLLSKAAASCGFSLLTLLHGQAQHRARRQPAIDIRGRPHTSPPSEPPPLPAFPPTPQTRFPASDRVVWAAASIIRSTDGASRLRCARFVRTPSSSPGFARSQHGRQARRRGHDITTGSARGGRAPVSLSRRHVCYTARTSRRPLFVRTDSPFALRSSMGAAISSALESIMGPSEFSGLNANPNAAIPQPTCPPSNSQFAPLFNQRRQDPCTIAWDLAGACVAGGQLTPANTLQLANNPCVCNSVMYSLAYVCGECSNTESLEVSSSTFFNFFKCSNTVYDESYPATVPPDTAIPAWAYLPLDGNGKVNLDAARNKASQNQPDATTQGSYVSQPSQGSTQNVPTNAPSTTLGQTPPEPTPPSPSTPNTPTNPTTETTAATPNTGMSSSSENGAPPVSGTTLSLASSTSSSTSQPHATAPPASDSTTSIDRNLHDSSSLRTTVITTRSHPQPTGGASPPADAEKPAHKSSNLGAILGGVFGGLVA